MSDPYYSDDHVTIYHGDCLELADVWVHADVMVTDPPYGETSLAWDRWPEGWPLRVAELSESINQLWCFGSTRMFLDRRDDFAAWKLAQDIVWSKPRGRGVTSDRFNRSHELVTHWYRGAWGDLRHETPRVPRSNQRRRDRGLSRRGRVDDGSAVKPMSGSGTYYDDGTRLMTTVIPGGPASAVGLLHPTQKPLEVLTPIIAYSCAPDGLIADPFMGSGSTLRAAKDLGRKAIGIELEERYCEIAAKRCAQEVLAL